MISPLSISLRLVGCFFVCVFKSWLVENLEIRSSPTGHIMRVRLLLGSVRRDTLAGRASQEEELVHNRDAKRDKEEKARDTVPKIYSIFTQPLHSGRI